jgi:hypothetical protein
MLSEDFDKRIRDAADHHHPAYDEKAWTKMEKLLNKHMPLPGQDRRRVLFILFFFLLLGGGAWIYFGIPEKKKTMTTTSEKTNPNDLANGTDNKNNNQNKEGITSNTINGENKMDRANPEKELVEPKIGIDEKIRVGPGTVDPVQHVAVSAGAGKAVSAGAGKKTVKRKNVKTDLPANKPATETGNEKTEIAVTPVQPGTDKTAGKQPVKENPVQDKTIPSNPITKEPVNEKKEELVSEKPQQKEKKSNKKSSFFFVSASVGADVSIAALSNPGKLKRVGGVGLGYTYKEKLTIRSGFYTGRKVYSAYPEDYHAPSALYQYYPNLQKVDANCKVYEIPVQLSYHFGKNSKRNYFASAGMSTYLMKEETYNFHYKYTPTSPTVTRERTFYNSNEHYFSVLTVSGGYQRNIGKSITVTAEPYVKVPVTGIGFGKVKLNSGGVLFSVAYKPFQRKSGK